MQNVCCSTANTSIILQNEKYEKKIINSEMTNLIEPNWHVHYKVYIFMVIVVIQDGLNSRTKLSIETSGNEERPQN